MPVEILTVGLDDATIEKLAHATAQWLARLNGSSPSVTPIDQNTRRTQTAQVSDQADDGWGNFDGDQTPPQYSHGNPPQTTTQPAPNEGDKHCQHGTMRWVPPGYSKATNKPYRGFWGCPAPRGTQCAGAID